MSDSGAPAREPGDPVEGARGSAFSAVRWTVAGRGALQLVRFLIAVALARLLLPSEFGVMAVALVVIGLLDLIGDLGTGQAVIQRKSLSRELLSGVFFANLALGTALGVSLALLAGPISAAYGGHAELPPVLRVLALNCAIASSGIVQRALLARAMQFRLLALADVAGALANGALAVVLAWRGHGVWALVLGYLAGTSVSTLGVWRLARFRPGLRVSWTDVREIAPFTLNLTAYNVIHYSLVHADALVISRLLGVEAMGYYAIAQRLVIYPMRTASQMIGTVLLPALARLQDDVARFRRDWLRACEGVVLVAFPLVAGVWVLAEPLVRVALGERWLAAVPAIMWMAPAALLVTPTHSAGSIYRAVGRTDWLLGFGLFSGALILIGYRVGAAFGLEGLIAGFGVAIALLFYPNFAIPFRLVGLRFTNLLVALRPYAGMTTAMSAVALAVRFGLEALGAGPVLVLAAGAAVGAAVYLGLGLWLRVPALEDLLRLLSPLRSARVSAARESGL